jgi:8-oxo-dGTP pyrophosphatase MutT (NUDIX family)
MSSHKSLPYRPCAGMMVLNSTGLVFVGRRTEGPEHVDATHVWQMPQGGIDEAVFGYTATMINRVAAIIYVTVTAPIAQSASTSSSK